MLSRARLAARQYSTLSTLRNQLSNATSPYLQSHKDNPVAWQQWNDKTLSLAIERDKPVFLSIGYHTCHYCHLMNRESFSNSTVAEMLNNDFTPIKLDREERPDVDSVYMMYLQATMGSGGWPLNVFLVPDTLEPIFGGTYWAGPGVTGRNAQFEDVLKAVRDIWTRDNEKCRNSASSVANQLRQLVKKQSEPEAAEFDANIFDKVGQHFVDSFDSVNGGFQHAPKFAMPHNLSTLIKYRDSMDNVADKAAFSLQKIGHSGVKDQIGHGFARYSVTEDWNLPHFEKMLYDQAMMLNAYTDAYKAEYLWAKEYMEDLIEYFKQAKVGNTDAFYSAQDADSLDNDAGHHREGAFYTWTDKDFHQALSSLSVPDRGIVSMYFNVHEQGNVDPEFDMSNELAYQNVLSVQSTHEQVAALFGVGTKHVAKVVANASTLLREYRQDTRESPSIDHKIITGWNGLAISALARAGKVLDNEDAIDLAVKAARYLKHHNYCKQTQSLTRVSDTNINGMNDDYSYLVSGLLDLYETTFDSECLEWAKELQSTQLRLFWDTNGGFFAVEEENATELIFRPKTGFDSAEPSSNGVAVSNLYRLATMLGNEGFEQRAVETLNCYGADLKAQPFGYLSMLGGVLARMNGMALAVIVGQGDPASVTLPVDPNMAVLRLDSQTVGMLESDANRELYKKHGEGEIRAFLCKDRSCRPI